MNFCVVSVQVILIAVFVVQYHYGFEVEADSQASHAVGNWFNSLERKVNVQATMNGVYIKIKKTANKFVDYPRRIFDHAIEAMTNSNDINEDVDLSEMVNSQEMADLYTATSFETRASEVASDEVKSEPDPEMITELHRKPKKKKKIKKHKKNRRKKRPPMTQELRTVTSSEIERAEFGKIGYFGNYRDEPRRTIHKKKFVKTAVKDGNNNSDSDESKAKPVDIIVHIKMNE